MDEPVNLEDFRRFVRQYEDYRNSRRLFLNKPNNETGIWMDERVVLTGIVEDIFNNRSSRGPDFRLSFGVARIYQLISQRKILPRVADVSAHYGVRIKGVLQFSEGADKEYQEIAAGRV